MALRLVTLIFQLKAALRLIKLRQNRAEVVDVPFSVPSAAVRAVANKLGLAHIEYEPKDRRDALAPREFP